MGPAGLIASKEINDLHLRETAGIPDVPLCLSHCIVSLEANTNPDFEPLEHSVYHSGQRLGFRHPRIAAQRHAAYDANDSALGDFKRKDACAAIGRAAAGAAQ